MDCFVLPPICLQIVNQKESANIYTDESEKGFPMLSSLTIQFAMERNILTEILQRACLFK
jgi:hypothetical protein